MKLTKVVSDICRHHNTTELLKGARWTQRKHSQRIRYESDNLITVQGQSLSFCAQFIMTDPCLLLQTGKIIPPGKTQDWYSTCPSGTSSQGGQQIPHTAWAVCQPHRACQSSGGCLEHLHASHWSLSKKETNFYFKSVKYMASTLYSQYASRRNGHLMKIAFFTCAFLSLIG